MTAHRVQFSLLPRVHSIIYRFSKMLRYWLCFASAVCLAGHCGANYCRDANLCCPGRDSACVVQKAHQNAIIEDLTDKPCYCDHACLKLGDCCPDFRETCGGKFHIFLFWDEVKPTFFYRRWCLVTKFNFKGLESHRSSFVKYFIFLTNKDL